MHVKKGRENLAYPAGRPTILSSFDWFPGSSCSSIGNNVNIVQRSPSMSSSCLYEPRIVARVLHAAFHSNEVKLCCLSLLSHVSTNMVVGMVYAACTHLYKYNSTTLNSNFSLNLTSDCINFYICQEFCTECTAKPLGDGLGEEQLLEVPAALAFCHRSVTFASSVSLLQLQFGKVQIIICTIWSTDSVPINYFVYCSFQLFTQFDTCISHSVSQVQPQWVLSLSLSLTHTHTHTFAYRLKKSVSNVHVVFQ